VVEAEEDLIDLDQKIAVEVGVVAAVVEEEAAAVVVSEVVTGTALNVEI